MNLMCPLHLVLNYIPINKEILLYLLQQGANPEIPNSSDKEKKNVLQRYTQRISNGDEAQDIIHSGAYELICEQVSRLATK